MKDTRSEENHETQIALHPISCLRTFPRLLLYVLIFASPAFGEPPGGGAASTTARSYSLGDVLIQSAIGKNETPFTPLSVWNFGEGWLEPWIPPPNGELHLKRGGWVNTASGFFPRNRSSLYLQCRDIRYARRIRRRFKPLCTAQPPPSNGPFCAVRG